MLEQVLLTKFSVDLKLIYVRNELKLGIFQFVNNKENMSEHDLLN